MAVLATAVLFVGAEAVRAADYSFNIIADTRNSYDGYQFASIMARPTLNDNGQVAFTAQYSNGQTIQGVYVGTSAGIDKIADSTDTVDGELLGTGFDGFVSINNSGVTAFTANNSSRIITGSTSSVAELYDTNDGFVTFYDRPHINNNGMVAFMADDGGTTSGIYRGNGGTPVVVQISNDSHPIAVPMMNDDNVVAWYAGSGVGGLGMWMNDGTGSTRVGDLADYPAASLGTPVNSQGVAAYTASGMTGGGGAGFLTATVDGGTEILYDATGEFAEFANAAISYNEDLGGQLTAFIGTLDDLQIGLFIGDDPVADKVLMEGDTLFGDTVQAIVFYGGGINDSHQLAFLATLEDDAGSYQAVILATPVPEPVTMVVLLVGGLGLVRARRRRMAA